MAFSADRGRFYRMLARMFGTAEDGLHDRLLDFSRPVTGAYYFAPSLSFLAAQGEIFDRGDPPAGENRPGVPMGLKPGSGPWAGHRPSRMFERRGSATLRPTPELPDAPRIP